MYTRSPTTIGLDDPCPGNLAFQSRLVVASHSAGNPTSAETPVIPIPRNCGQSAAKPDVAIKNKKAADPIVRFMEWSPRRMQMTTTPSALKLTPYRESGFESKGG